MADEGIVDRIKELNMKIIRLDSFVSNLSSLVTTMDNRLKRLEDDKQSSAKKN